MLATKEPTFSRRLPLDGLRGVFVLVVILFHLDFEWIRFGFVGVDAFFVLSGFVISSKLAVRQSEMESSSLVSQFYASWGKNVENAYSLT